MVFDNKQLIKNVFRDIFSNLDFTEETCEKYFSINYIQYVDGKKLDYDKLIKHLMNLKSTLHKIKITFKHIISEHDKVSTIHIVNATKKNGVVCKVQVNAMFQIKNQKIILCDELTHLISGEGLDKEIASNYFYSFI